MTELFLIEYELPKVESLKTLPLTALKELTELYSLASYGTKTTLIQRLQTYWTKHISNNPISYKSSKQPDIKHTIEIKKRGKVQSSFSMVELETGGSSPSDNVLMPVFVQDYQEVKQD